MLDATLESSVFLGRGEILTPTLVAKAFDRAVLEVPHGWQAEAILRHTRLGTKGFPFRDQISLPAVRLAFNNAIEYALLRSLKAAPNIVSHIADDERLLPAVSPKYISDRVSSYLSEGRLKLATFNFQATELSPKHRKAFSPDDVASLYQEVDTAREWDLVSEIFSTTDKTPEYRQKIKPEDARRTFLKCLDVLEGIDNQVKYQASETAMDLLRYTIADRRFREAGGITQDEIERLKAYFVKITQSCPKDESDRKLHESTVVWFAKWNLTFVDICNLNPNDVEAILRLKKEYIELFYRNSGYGSEARNQHRCIQALESYPALKAEMLA